MDKKELGRRAARITEMVRSRVERDELTRCRFSITIPKAVMPLETDKGVIKRVVDILERNNIGWHKCDTIPGTYNLNRDFIDTDIMDCAVEYCGVYPTQLKATDSAILEDLDYSGKIIILVSTYDKDGKFIGMNT